MSAVSVFDLFKIGIGPSSSHTMGPWEAAREFMKDLENLKANELSHVIVELYGSLALTGKGHNTDKALAFGLMNLAYDDDQVKEYKDLGNFSNQQFAVQVKNGVGFQFCPENHLVWIKENDDEFPNTMKFIAHAHDKILYEETYFSIGGGSIVRKSDVSAMKEQGKVKSLNNPEEILKECAALKCDHIVYMRKREVAMSSEDFVSKSSEQLSIQLQQTVVNGLTTEGVLPGSLKVKRRASKLFQTLTKCIYIKSYKDIRTAMRSRMWSFDEVNTLISAIAMACNEENASMNQIVTAPTNGACGVIPASMYYFDSFHRKLNKQEVEEFLLTAGMVGIIFKNASSISGAVGGCMAEVGVASSMAAAGLVHLKGGDLKQIFMAAEIAMEHHLGLTCDPIAGLVQVPCIERNAMGAIKAITASNIAMNSSPDEAIVKFKDILEVMNDTAENMDKKFKETSLGGLAIKVNLPEC